MTKQQGEQIRDAAIAWHLSLKDADEAAWLSFTEWLEADPAHDAAYDEVTLLDDRIDAATKVAPALIVANDDYEPAREPANKRRWLMPVAAAFVALMLGTFLTFFLNPARGIERIATPPGQTRVIDIAGAGQIALNGDTLVTYDRRNSRKVKLERGEAEFRVIHDAAKPFSVALGDNEVVDLGTVFNLVRDGNQVSVQVAEGSVIFNPRREAVKLVAGDAILVDAASGSIVRTKVAPDSVGGWRKGRLDYRQASVSAVAADLARAIGQPVKVGPGLDTLRFTGTIKVSKDRKLLMQQVQALLDVKATAVAGGWLLSPHDPALR
jgi:transmembrane sensor